jgi:hypothetical protein
VRSALKNIANYAGDRDLPQFHKLYEDMTDVINPRYDLVHLKKENEQLNKLQAELETNNKVLGRINTQLLQEAKAVADSQNNLSKYNKWNNHKNQQLVKQIDSRIHELYLEYRNELVPQDIQQIEREDKLTIMRDVLSLEFGSAFANPTTVFSAFHAQDLIIFGLENNIAEAVRLGEQMTSEIGETLSRELAMEVKNYLLENSEKYREVMRTRGPIDNASLYIST